MTVTQTKKDISSFEQLAAFAGARAHQSLRRNDPWAWAYWFETRSWALRVNLVGPFISSRAEWLSFIQSNLQEAGKKLASRDWSHAARAYSRAKWCVIMARNLGFKMNPRETGVTPSMFNREML